MASLSGGVMDTLTTDMLLATHYPAVVVPTAPVSTVFSHIQLIRLILNFQQKLGSLGVRSQDTVAIACPNSLEFVVAFLATTSSRAIAAPLNSAYKQSEFEFYFSDLQPSVLLVPKGSLLQNTPAIQAAQTCKVPIAEIHFDLDAITVAEYIKMGRIIEPALPEQPRPDDIALVLHTSGTTGRPKIVRIDNFHLRPSC
jgi:acyl-CoA synthetase (AMP-forming)/AMP-acid ligase II